MSRRRKPSHVERAPVGALLALLVFALAIALGSARAIRAEVAPVPAIELRIAAEVPPATASRLRAAVASQLTGLATLSARGDRGGPTSLGVIYVEPGERGILVRIVASDGQPLARPRRVPGPLTEASASEIASIVHAFVSAADDALVTPGSALEERSRSEPEHDQPAVEAAPAAALPPADTGPGVVANVATDTKVEPQGVPIGTSAAATRSERRPNPHPVSSAQPEVPERALWRMRLFGMYSGGQDSDALPWRHAVRAESAVRLWRGIYAGTGYAYVAPSELTRPAAKIRVRGHAVSAFAGVVHRFGSFGLGGDLAFTFARSQRETLYTAPGFSDTPDSVRWEPLLALRAHALLRVHGVPRLTLDLAPALELALARHELVLDGELANSLSSPRLLRARVDVGACFDLF